MNIFPDWIGPTGTGGGTVTIYADQFDIDLTPQDLTADIGTDTLTADIGHPPIEITIEEA